MPWRRKPDGRPFARIQLNGVRFQQSLLIEGETSRDFIPDDEVERRYRTWRASLPENPRPEAIQPRRTPRGNNPTIPDFVDWYLDTYLAARGNETRTQARSRLQRFARWADAHGLRRLVDLDSMAAADFARDLGQGGRHPNTVAGYIRYLRGAVNAWCLHAGTESPVTIWPSARHQGTQVTVLSRDEARAFLEWIRTQRPRYYPVFLWLYRTAMRLGDALRLTWGNVDIESGRVHLHMGKTGAAHAISLHPDAVTALQVARLQHPSQHPGKTDLIFCTKKGTSYPRQALQVNCRRASEALGFRVHPHLLRHTAAVELLHAGAPVVAVQRFLGHATPAQTLNTYGQFAPGIETEYLARLPQVAPHLKNGTPKP